MKRHVSRLLLCAAALLCAAPPALAAQSDGQHVRPGEVPRGLSADAWADIQRQLAEARYEAAPVPAEPETVAAHNSKQNLLLHFDDDGARVASLRNASIRASGAIRHERDEREAESARPALRLQTLAFARGDREQSAGSVAPVADKSRIEYRHDGWTEWYVNRAAGLEHGYTLEQKPLDTPARACGHSGRTVAVRSCRVGRAAAVSRHGSESNSIRIRIAVSGLRAAETANGLRFSDNAGHSLHYGKLLVVDADGKTLPASMSAPAADRIEIAFDDSTARYPVTVDPLLVNQEQFIPNPGGDFDGSGYRTGEAVDLDGDTLIIGAPGALGTGAAWVFVPQANGVWTLQARLIAADGAPDDEFGFSVALNGDTALVGAFRDDVAANTDQGSATVFTRTGTSWTQQQQLTAADGAAGDLFGRSVALDGDTALVGALLDDVGANSNQGSAYAFTRTGSSWTQQQQLSAGDGAANDQFGFSVALSGDTALVGALRDDVGANVNQGSAYVFTRAGTNWTVQQQLTANDGSENDSFGFAVALDGDTALVGARDDDIGASGGQGSAYVFSRAGTSWTQQARLTAADGTENDRFGRSVALDGDTALVGADGDDVGGKLNQGSAYVFTRTGTSWSQQQQLIANDGAANDSFGSSVALDGDTALVGAVTDDVGANSDQGSATVFARAGTNWSQQQQLIAADGAAGDSFGSSVALDGDTALVGAASDDVGINGNQGSAYVFARSGTRWTQQARLTAADGAAGDEFGRSVALDGNTALIGVPFDDVGVNSDQGSATVFTRAGTSWSQQQQLTAADGAAGDEFGRSVALDGDTALVGADEDDVGENSDQGSVTVFTRSGSSWIQQQQLTATDGAARDFFGRSVALDGNTALIGVPFDDVGANADQGSAYVFTRAGMSWSQQQRLTAAGGAAPDGFGEAVALDGDTALVGAFLDDIGANTAQGSATVFTRSGSNWTVQQQLTAANGAAGDQFGRPIALDGDTALVGVGSDDVGINSIQGSAYVFTRTGTSWSQQQQLTAIDGAAFDQFGVAVALDADTALIGADFDDIAVGVNGGSVHLFRLAADYGDAPAPYPTLRADDGARHLIDSSGPQLGSEVDAEPDGQPDAGASGDDLAGTDDEDGASFSSLPPGSNGSVTVTVANAAGLLDAWVDFNGDSDWLDAGEQVFDGDARAPGVHVLSFPVPLGAAAGETFARLRLSSNGADAPTGTASNGEVEDHRVTILPPDSDGDGMSNDFETANGLDPNNPNDAGLDADGDGLTNLQEFNAGTQANNPDTDGDGIGDAIDADPTVASNACADTDAAFENELVLDGTVVQCAASGSVQVESTVTVEPGARIEVFSPDTTFSPGFSLPVGAELGVVP